MMRWLDLPPVWLVAALAAAWVSPWRFPWGALPVPGALLFLLAGVVTLAALYEFRRARTTFVPRRDPEALITTGIFRWTRNPIYLADGMILLGLSLLWGKVLGVALVLPFLWLIRERFILPEEARLRAHFGDAFEAYARQTRRWL